MRHHTFKRHALCLGLLLTFTSISSQASVNLLPSIDPTLIGQDDVLNAQVDTTKDYTPVTQDFQWVTNQDNLPRESKLLPSNNCVGIAYYDGRLFMGWRNAPSHFASDLTHIFIISSQDFCKTWDFENSIYMGTDMREPFFLNFQGQLIFSFFQAGTDPIAFQPQHLFRIVRNGFQDWTAPQIWGDPGEIAWELKVRNGKAWMTSYIGNHYRAGPSDISVRFKSSTDGFNWTPVYPSDHAVYTGGVSEVGYDFDQNQNLWAVGRNEDGDTSGFGSFLANASSDRLGDWQMPATANPNRYDSPRMFRHGKDLYLVARHDLGTPYGDILKKVPYDLRKWLLLAEYSVAAPKRTALYKINTVTKNVDWLYDLPSAGDTAFPSILRLGADSFLIANYTSPLEHTKWNWTTGQTSKEGTDVYFIQINFVPNGNSAP